MIWLTRDLLFLWWWFSCWVMSNSVATPWTIACQSPLNMGFPKQEYWSGLTFPSSGDLSHPRDRICVSCINRHILFHWAISEAWQEIKLQNTQTAHTAQYQKNKQPSRKNGQKTQKFFLQKRHTDGQMTQAKMLSITVYYRNANQKYNEVSPHTSQDDQNQKVYKY